MPKPHPKRYCASTRHLATLARDGLGWGHDLDCGCFHVESAPAKQGLIMRAYLSLKKRS